MQKLIVKTIALTLGLIIIVGVAISGCLCLFYPKAIGRVAENTGNYKVACWAYSKQYQKNSDKITAEEVNGVYIKYAVEEIEDDDYDDATDFVILAKKEGKIIGNDVLQVVKLQLETKKNYCKDADDLAEITECITIIERNIT